MARHLIVTPGPLADDEELGGLLRYRNCGPGGFSGGAGELGLVGLSPEGLAGDPDRVPFQAGWWRKDLVIPVLIAVSCTCGVSTMRPTLDCFVQWLTMILAMVLACLRIDGLRRTEAEMMRFQDENGEFRQSNEALKAEVDGLYGKNAELKITNQDLQLNVTRLDEVRQVIQDHASKTQKDVGAILQDFHMSVSEQNRILEATRQIQQHTRRHADMEWRAMLMNRFYALCSDQEGTKGLMREDFKQLLSMLPSSISQRAKDFSFECVDLEGKGYVDDKNMVAWVELAAAKIIDMDSERPGVETPRGRADPSGFGAQGGGGDQMAPSNPSAPGARRRDASRSSPVDSRRSRSTEASSYSPESAALGSADRDASCGTLGKESRSRESWTPSRGTGRDRERSIGSCSTSGSPMYTNRTCLG
jgi:hypothetical protein